MACSFFFSLIFPLVRTSWNCSAGWNLALLQADLEGFQELLIFAPASRLGQDVALGAMKLEPTCVALQEGCYAVVVGMEELAIRLGAMRSFVDDHAGHVEGRLLNGSEKTFLEAPVQHRVPKPSKDRPALDDVLPVQADRRIVGVPAEQIRLQGSECLGKAPVGALHLEPDSEQSQVAVVVAFSQLESMVSGLVDVQPVALFHDRAQSTPQHGCPPTFRGGSSTGKAR